MQSKHIDVSYFAAGIIAHLTSNDHSEEAWVSTAATRKEILSDLYLVVSKWKTPEEEMVAYRSFRPFFPLMGTSQPYPVQMWAVWAINHVCSKNGKHHPPVKGLLLEIIAFLVSYTATRYCPMLVKQGGSDVIMKLLEDSETHIRVIRLCESIVKSLRQEGVVSKVFVDTVYNLIRYGDSEPKYHIFYPRPTLAAKTPPSPAARLRWLTKRQRRRSTSPPRWRPPPSKRTSLKTMTCQ